MTGYDELRSSAASLDLSARGKIKVSGEDRARLLHAMSTNHIQQLQPGQGCYAFFLNAQGRIVADANVFCRDDHFLLDTEPELKDKLIEHLDKFIIVDDVQLEDVTESMPTTAVEGPAAPDVLRAAGASAPEADYALAEWGPRLVARVSYTGGPGYFVFGPAPELAAAPADLEAFETVRVENGKPRYGADITERYLPQETDQMQALHFQKGCYLGQEIVERIRSRAQIHRRLHRVELQTDHPPAPGTKLSSGDKPAGEITSAVYSPAKRDVIALAYIRVELERSGTPVECEGISGVVT